MSQSSSESNEKPTAIRARLEKFQTIDEFAAGYQQHFLANGIRLPTRQVKPVGTRVSLKLELASGATALRADGVVQQIRENASGVPVAMDIRFERVDAASQALIRRIEAERSWPRGATGPQVQLPDPAEVRTSEGTADFEAIADELDSTFDSIFAAGPFADATGSDPDDDHPGEPQRTLLQRPGALDAALAGVAGKASDGPPEWASSLPGEFQVATPSAPRPADMPTSSESDDAAALLAAFGMGTTAGESAEAPAAPVQEPSAPTEDAADDGGAQPIGRIAFQKVSRAELEAARASEDERPRLEGSSRRPPRPADTDGTAGPGDADWGNRASLPVDLAPSPAADKGAVDDDLRSLMQRITSDHAAVPDLPPLRPLATAPTPPATPPSVDDDDDAFGDLLKAPALSERPPAPEPGFPPSPLGRPTTSDRSAVPDAASDELPAPFNAPPASQSSAPGAATPLATADAAPKGLFARFFAWLRGLFGG